MEIHTAEGKKLENTVLFHLDGILGQNHHTYLNNFYNSVRLLDRKVRVCGTARANRANPPLEKRAVCSMGER
jgi:hypothetical protein